MSVIQGENVIIEMKVGNEYFDILCGTDCSFTRTPEFIEKTTTTSGLFKEWAIRIEEWSMSVSGLTKVDNDTALTFFYMLQNSVRRTQQTVRITFTDDEGNSIQIEGNVLIGQENINGPLGDFAQCTIELKGTGQFSISAVTEPTPTDFNIISDYWQSVNGQDYINGASAISSITMAATDTILGVFVEGTEFDLINGSPTAGARECRFVTSPVKIEFPLTFDGTQRIFVIIKRPV